MPRSHRVSPSWRHAQELHESLTVGELAREISALPPCAAQLTLREAAQILLSTGHAAGCVVDEPLGMNARPLIEAKWTRTVWFALKSGLLISLLRARVE